MIDLIDMHCHILPEVDDGAYDMGEMLSMAQIAWDDGIRTMVVTPHFHPRKCKMEAAEILQRFHQMQDLLNRSNAPLHLFLGREIFYEPDLINKVRQKRIQTMNETNVILLEFAEEIEERVLLDNVKSILDEKYRVIVAHVERYENLSLDGMQQLVKDGAWLQVNASSVVAEKADDLLDRHLVFCIGSDAHDIVYRPPKMREAADYLEEHYGPATAEKLCHDNILEVLRLNEIQII